MSQYLHCSTVNKRKKDRALSYQKKNLVQSMAKICLSVIETMPSRSEKIDQNDIVSIIDRPKCSKDQIPKPLPYLHPVSTLRQLRNTNSTSTPFKNFLIKEEQVKQEYSVSIPIS